MSTTLDSYGNTSPVIKQIRDGRNTISFAQIEDFKSVENAKRIIVNSSIATVTINTSPVSSVTARLHGNCTFTGFAPKLQMIKGQEEIHLSVIFVDSFISGRLYLEITVPSGLYDLLKITTDWADIFVESNVSSESFLLDSQLGSIWIQPQKAHSILARTVSGNIDLKLVTNPNITAILESTYGDVRVKFENDFILDTALGHTCNNFHHSTGFSGDISARTKKGFIRV